MPKATHKKVELAPSRTKRTAQASDKRRRVTIDNLPVEILCIIFKLVYDESAVVPKEYNGVSRSYPGTTYRPPQERGELCLQNFIPEPSLFGGWVAPTCKKSDPELVELFFPLHELGSVCREWRAIAQAIPEFWSRFDILIDEKDPTPLSHIQAQADRCPVSVPLNILVTRRDFPELDEDFEPDEAEIKRESTRAKEVMKVLAPLIPRCISFVFLVLHSSSLPYISQDFRGEAPHLRALKLKALLDDENFELPPLPEIAPKDEFKFPRLVNLDLFGYTFMDTCRMMPWRKQMHELSLDTVVISNFTAPPAPEDEEEWLWAGGLIDGLSQHISNIGYVRHLILCDLTFPPVEDDPSDNPLHAQILPVDNMTLNNIDSSFAERFFSNMGTTLCYLNLMECSVTPDSLPLTYHLRISDPPDDSFLSALTQFFGHRLDISDYEDLSDDDLLTIARSCEQLRRLYITRCPKITVAGVKKMIELREELVAKRKADDERLGRKGGEGDFKDSEMDDPGSDTVSFMEANRARDAVLARKYYNLQGDTDQYVPIHRLEVLAHPAELSPADRTWFKKRVRSFYWHTAADEDEDEE